LLKGAEAVIIEEDGKIIKRRIEKPYRDKRFDEWIRKKRTEREAKIIKKLSNVVNVPKIIEVKDYEIIMEKIDAKPLKEVKIEDKEFWKSLGFLISKIHENQIIHGDLTTKNILVGKDNVYFIDFGLSFFSSKVEDKAMDLIVLKDILTLEKREDKFNLIIEGYKSKDKEKILKRIEEIERRGRYKRKKL